jgi:hypothetical protein
MDSVHIEQEKEFVRKEKELIVPGYLRFFDPFDPDTYTLFRFDSSPQPLDHENG